MLSGCSVEEERKDQLCQVGDRRRPSSAGQNLQPGEDSQAREDSRYGFASFSSISVSTVGVDGAGGSLGGGR